MDFSLFQAFCGNIPSESYRNVHIVQGNDYAIDGEYIGKIVPHFAVIASHKQM